MRKLCMSQRKQDNLRRFTLGNETNEGNTCCNQNAPLGKKFAHKRHRMQESTHYSYRRFDGVARA